MATDQEIVDLYVKVLEQRRPLRIFIREPTGIFSLVDIIERPNVNLNEIHVKYPNFDPTDIAMIYYNVYTKRLSDDLIYNNIVNFYSSLGISVNTLNLDVEFRSWSQIYDKERNKDVKTASKIIKSLSIINQTVNQAQISPLKYTYVTRESYPTIKVQTDQGLISKSPTIEDGLDLFDFAVPSYDIPYIQYNKITNELIDNYDIDIGSKYKIYRGDSSNPIPLDLTIPAKADVNEKNTIYLTIFIGKPNEKFTKENFIMATYNLETNKLIFSVPLRNGYAADNILNKIQACLHVDIDINKVVDLTVGATFMIYTDYIDHHLLSYAILNKEPFNTFLYIDERSKPTALKKVHRLRYRSLQQYFTCKNMLYNSAWITFSNIETASTLLMPYLSEGVEENVQLEKGETYIEVSIMKALDKNITENIYYQFPKMIQYYLNNLNNYRFEIGSYFPLKEQDKKKQADKSTKKKTTRKINALKEKSQGYIGKKYGTTCQCPKQPIIIDQSEVPEWNSKAFIYKGITYPREAMPFPPDNPLFYIVCTSENYPFPGILIEDDPESKLPYVPCCFKKKQNIPLSGTVYDYIYNKNPLKSTNKKNKVILDTGKSVDNGRFGKLPDVVIKLLKKNMDADGLSYYRYGVTISPNSLLHCIMTAFNYEDYIKLPDDNKEDFIRNYRRVVFGRFDKYSINVMKQELYDFTDDEIKDILVNPDAFLDPALYYRYLEEIFGINIYVFTTPKNNESNYAMLEAPRNKLFHTRRYHDKSKCIIIFKNNNYDKNLHPQCELIVYYNDENREIDEMMFESDMSKLLYDVIIKTKNTLSWSIDPTNMSITTRKNLFNTLDSYGMLRDRKLIGQHIDNYGKNRAFIFDENGTNVVVVVPPCQPENLPNFPHLNVARPTKELVYRLFGNDPTFVSVGSNGLVNGLWYKVLDIEEGIYVPIQEVELSQFPGVPVGNINPIYTDQENLIKRYKNMQKVNKIILTVIQWLFIKSKLELKDFIEQYFMINSQPVVDSNTIYNTRKIRRLLPDVSDFNICMSYIKNNVEGLIHDNTILLYSKKYAEGVIYYLKEYLKSTPEIVAPKEINAIKDESDDFLQFNSTLIFTRENDMRIWYFSNSKMGLKTAQIHHKINFSDNSTQEPFIYQDPSGKYYYIQNVANSDFRRAINVALKWYTLKKNYTYDIEPYMEKVFPSHVVYVINSGNTLSAAKDNSNADENYLQILNYGEDQYAGILPL
jgi:hypothetical protein